jgi:hypothetical protein
VAQVGQMSETWKQKRANMRASVSMRVRVRACACASECARARARSLMATLPGGGPGGGETGRYAAAAIDGGRGACKSVSQPVSKLQVGRRVLISPKVHITMS